MALNEDTEFFNEVIGFFPKMYRLFHGYRMSKSINSAISLTHLRTLFQLSMREGCTLKELAEGQQITSASLSTIIQSLVEMELVTRLEDDHDRRCVRLYLTEKGKQELNAEIKNQAEHWLQSIAVLTPQEKHSMIEAMKTVTSLRDRIEQRLAEKESDGSFRSAI